MKTVIEKLKMKAASQRGDASSDTMITIIIGIALAIVVVGVLSASFGDIAELVVAKLTEMISGT